MFVGDIFVRWLKVIMYSVRKVGRAGRDISVVTFTAPSQPGAGCNRLIEVDLPGGSLHRKLSLVSVEYPPSVITTYCGLLIFGLLF